MRAIVTHKGSSLNDALTLQASEELSPGGAPYEYLCSHKEANPYVPGEQVGITYGLKFQVGEPAQGINGLSNEVLLAIVRDRLECFQVGPFACDENAEALQYICEAMHSLQQRTIERTKRGVEGTTQL